MSRHNFRMTTLMLALSASTAQAGVVFNLSAFDVYATAVAGATTIDFNDGSCGAYVSCEGDYRITAGNYPGRYASPLGIYDNFISVPEAKGGGVLDQVTLVLDGDYDYYGLYWGSIDSYNAISFYQDGALVDSFGGGELSPLQDNGGQGTWDSNRYINFYFTDGALFDTVVLASSNYAFESDNHAYARVGVPEPGTMALFAMGLLGLIVTRRRIKMQ